MKMPWGKHIGEELEDLDDGYLRWIAENVTSDTALVNAAEEQLMLREGRGVARRRED